LQVAYRSKRYNLVFANYEYELGKVVKTVGIPRA